MSSSCYDANGASRGTVFVTADGTSATFVSDGVINDAFSTHEVFSPAGYLMMRDGTRYRIDNGRVSWMRDRNGNRLEFGYGSGQIAWIKDSLNRQVNITYQSDPSVPYDVITVKGFQGNDRPVKVLYARLRQVLRLDFPGIRTYSQLFPELDGSSSTDFNPFVVSAVELPDGRFYRFAYNPYGELARVDLPTGGAMEYDYPISDGSPWTSGVIGYYSDFQIYRRVKERRVYSANNVLEKRTVFTPSYTTSPGASTTVEVSHFTANETLMAKEKHRFHGNPQESLLVVKGISYPGWKESREYETERFDANGTTVLRRQSDTWQQRAPVNWWTGAGEAEPPNDPRVGQSQNELVDANQVSRQAFAYDLYNNRTDTWEYDFGTGAPGALLRHTYTDYLEQVGGVNYATNTNIHLRSLPATVSAYNGSGVEESRTAYEYDNYTPDATHAALITCHSGNCGTVSGLDSAFSTGYTTRDNVTSVGRWVKANDSWIFSYQQYDVVGNVVKSIDPRGKLTTIFFDDQFGAPTYNVADSTPPSDLQGAKSFAFPTKVINPLGHTTEAQYDYYLGRFVDFKDANNVITSTGSSNDPLDRPTWIVRAHNKPEQNLTLFSYDDLNRIVTTSTDKDFYNDQQIKTQVVYDGLGREIETRQYESPNAFIVTRQEYDALGRVEQVSNPFRLAPQYWTLTQYDALSRVTAVIAPGGAATTMGYSGNATTVTDPSGNPRRSLTDALGRLVRVDEPDENRNLGPATSPYQATTYVYDVLDNLKTITQGGQTRTFVYDSLSRLTAATNPESGTVSYQYDPSGNLLQKVDARGVTTTLSYDDLNRVAAKSYSDTTPAVSYCYDGTGTGCPSQVLYPVGRLTKVSCLVSTTSYDEYDAMGQVKRTTQTIGDSGYTLLYGYNLAGGMKSQTYPSGRILSTSYDQAARIGSITGSKSGEPNKTYASNYRYSPHGAVAEMKLGNELWENASYNERLQPTLMGLGTTNANSSFFKLDLDYSNGAPASNNGNLLSQGISVGTSTLTQNYTYDPLNRLKTAAEGSNWSQTYDIDRYGNRAVSAGTILAAGLTPASLSHFDPGTNRLLNSGYDSAGNLTTDGTNRTITYDAENRQASFTTPGQATVYYSYDGQGQRVKKTVSGQDTLFVYNVLGQLVADYSEQGPQGTRGTLYLTSDHLSSTRVVTDASRVVKARHDYVPFGEEIPASYGRSTIAGYGGSDGIRQKFTQKERDSESNLDYFLARHYSGAQGRYKSADEPLLDQHQGDPQSWNLYTYVRNSPLRFTDPTGNACVDNGQGGYKDDDGPGGTCREALQGDIKERKKPSLTVTEQGPPSPLLWAVALGAQRARTPVNYLAGATAVVTGGAALAAGYTSFVGGYGLIELGIASGPLVGLLPQEMAMARELIQQGHKVEAIPRAIGKTADFVIDGVVTELKTLTGVGPNTLKNAIQTAAKQGENILVDARKVGITPESALQEIQRAHGNLGNLQGRVTVLTQQGPVKY